MKIYQKYHKTTTLMLFAIALLYFSQFESKAIDRVKDIYKSFYSEENSDCNESKTGDLNVLKLDKFKLDLSSLDLKKEVKPESWIRKCRSINS